MKTFAQRKRIPRTKNVVGFAALAVLAAVVFSMATTEKPGGNNVAGPTGPATPEITPELAKALGRSIEEIRSEIDMEWPDFGGEIPVGQTEVDKPV